MKFNYLICILFIFMSSAQESSQKAIQAVKTFIKADHVAYSTGYVHETDKGLINYIELEISGGELINNEKSPDHHLLSVVAFVFYNSLSNNDKKDKNAIKIKINRDFGTAKKEVSKTYKFTELEDIVLQHNTLIKVIQNMMVQDYQSVYRKFDDIVKANLEYPAMLGALEKMDHKYGKIIDFHLQDFYTEKQESGEIFTYLSYTLKREHHKSGCDICVRKVGNKITIINIRM